MMICFPFVSKASTLNCATTWHTGSSLTLLFLAGGLTPGNVAEAVRVSGARQVDVSSGVERAPGIKDHGMIRAFVAAAG